MPMVYKFESQDIRIVFIDEKPWFVDQDIASCLDFRTDQLLLLAQKFNKDVIPEDTLIIGLSTTDDTAVEVRLFSLETTCWFTDMTKGDRAKRFSHWIDTVFKSRPTTCQKVTVALHRLDRGLRGLDGVIDLIGSIHTSGQDLHEVNTENLAYLLDLVRDELKTGKDLIPLTCQYANRESLD